MRSLRHVLLLFASSLAACHHQATVVLTIDDPGTAVDAAAPADLARATADAAPSCQYIDLATDHQVLSCKDLWVTIVRSWDVNHSTACPDVYSTGGNTFPSRAEAAASAHCATDCIWVPGQASLGLRCGQKGETTTYHDGGLGQTTPAGTCEDLVHADFSSAQGWYLASQTDGFWAMHPCP